jgi:aminopeptidase N
MFKIVNSFLALIFLLNVISTTEITAANKNKFETAERKYARDRKVDILHVLIDVTPDFDSRTIQGKTTISFSPIAKPLRELRLDAIELEVSSVRSSADISNYSVTDEAIIISFEPSIEPGVETTLTISYEAEPKKGLFFRTPYMGYLEEDMHLFTQGEPQYTCNWYPCYDYPNERFTSEVICHVPENMTVLSNGRLIREEVEPKTSLRSFRWLQDKPHVNYLIALAAGKFKKIESKYKDVPLAFYTPASQIEQAENSFKDTADMMSFFEHEIGLEYPWNKYYQVVVDDFVAGGMENTTLTILNDYTLHTRESENIISSQTLVSHELVHQWFGDYVTCKDWSHSWLNEGFATYYALLYDEHKDGRDEMLYGLYRNKHGIVSDGKTCEIPIIHRTYDSPREQFNWHRNYAKGAWVVHMLRSQLGPELYRKCIKTYMERYALGTVVTENLNAVIEELTGRSFDRFFDEWIFHAGHPVLDVSYEWMQKEKLARFSVKQTQETDDKVLLFHFPTKVRFIVGGESIDHDIFIEKDKHDFYFPLDSEPNIVRFDPEYSVLADIKFKKPKEMLYSQLENQRDVVGRLLAIEGLKKKDDKKTIEKLKDALNNDPFYGVRKLASTALQKIHSDEAFEALADSLNQSDARVRKQVVKDICGFYRPESLDITRKILQSEKNPEIVYEAILNLGRYQDPGSKQLIMEYLESKSYRNKLAIGAIKAIDKLKDPSFTPQLKDVLGRRESNFRAYDFANGLKTLGRINAEQEDKAEIRDFLAGYVNHKKERITAGAVKALGELADLKAIAIVETIAGDDKDDLMQRTAKKALGKLRKETKLVPEEIVKLRETVDEVKKENEKLREDLDDLKKRFEAQQKWAENANKTEAKSYISVAEPNE